jgi:hemerythrin superfamily protein
MPTVFEVLSRDHEEVKQMLSEFEKGPTAANGASPDELALRKKMAETLVIEESKHEAVEEMYFWPAVRDRLPDGGRLADEATGQEQQAKQVLDRLDRTGADDPEFEKLLSRFITAGREHIAFEEARVWPGLRSALTSTEAEELGEKLEQAKETAPTRPHPGTPPLPGVLKSIGPVVAVADKARDTVIGRGEGAQGLSGLVPRLLRLDLIPAVERYFDLVQRMVDVNRFLTVKWVEAAGTLTGVVRDQAESAAGVVREVPASVGHAVHEQAAEAEQAVREQAEKAEQAEQERARQARKAEREQARQAHDKAREPYEGLTKAVLSGQLAERGLPKTGNVDELIERLVEDDKARERYEGLTKAELSDQLAARDLPKTGTVDELTKRLIEADSK